MWANDWVSSRLSDNGIFKLTLQLDWRVLTFAVGVSIITGLFFGLVPAWLMTRVQVNDSLKSGTRGNTGMSGSITVVPAAELEQSAPATPTPAPQSDTGSPASAISVDMLDASYSSPELTVPTGAVVTFVNAGNAPHSATADDTTA